MLCERLPKEGPVVAQSSSCHVGMERRGHRGDGLVAETVLHSWRTGVKQCALTDEVEELMYSGNLWQLSSDCLCVLTEVGNKVITGRQNGGNGMKSSFKKMERGYTGWVLWLPEPTGVHVHEYEMKLFITVGVVFFSTILAVVM